MAGADAAFAGPAGGAGRMRRLIASDTAVVVASVVTLNLLRIVSTVILTRLLTPDVFGAMGLIASLAFVLQMISDLGFQAFVVRHPDGDAPGFLDAIWTIRLIRAVVLTAALVALAAPVAALLEKPGVAALIAVSAAQFAIEGVSSLAPITALRDRRLVRLSLLEIVAALVQLAVSVAVALLWRNAWALVVAMLAASAVKTWLSYALFAGARRRWRIDPVHGRELWAFARFVTGSSVISMVLVQADKLVLSRLFALDVFGLYVLAGNLALAPIAFVGNYASRVLFPAYARAWREEPARLPALYYDGRRAVSLLYMAGAGGLIGGAPLLVALLYDPRYAGAAIYLRLLAVTPLLALGSAAANEVLTATGRVQATFRANLAKLAWLGVVGPAGFLLAGPIGLVAAVGAVEAPTLAYSWWALRRAGLLNLGEEAKLAAAALAGGAAGLGADMLLRPFMG